MGIRPCPHTFSVWHNRHPKTPGVAALTDADMKKSPTENCLHTLLARDAPFKTERDLQVQSTVIRTLDKYCRERKIRDWHPKHENKAGEQLKFVGHPALVSEIEYLDSKRSNILDAMKKRSDKNDTNDLKVLNAKIEYYLNEAKKIPDKFKGIDWRRREKGFEQNRKIKSGRERMEKEREELQRKLNKQQQELEKRNDTIGLNPYHSDYQVFATAPDGTQNILDC